MDQSPSRSSHVLLKDEIQGIQNVPLQSGATIASNPSFINRRRAPDVGNSRAHAIAERISSASVGALMTSLVVTPLEVVKVRLQTQASARSSSSKALMNMTAIECSACKEIFFDNGLMEHRVPKRVVECCDKHVTFKGTWDALTWIIRCEGVGSLFNGLSATLWMAIPATVLYFASYEELRDRLNVASPSTRQWNPLVSGAIARVFAATSVAPLELIRTNAQAEVRPPSLVTMARNIAQTKGILTFWRGLSPTLWRDVPFSAIYWLLVEKLRSTEIMRRQDSLFLVSAVCGATSGVVSAVMTHPFDVIKTRRQVFDLAHADPPSKSTFGMMAKIVTADGWSGLWIGLLPRMMKIAPSTAIMLTTYELGKKFFHKAL